jgi:hypothetical protein
MTKTIKDATVGARTYKLAAKGESAEFFVTRIGCGLAGYEDKDIAPMFKGVPDNCSFANEWKEYLND